MEPLPLTEIQLLGTPEAPAWYALRARRPRREGGRRVNRRLRRRTET